MTFNFSFLDFIFSHSPSCNLCFFYSIFSLWCFFSGVGEERPTPLNIGSLSTI